ncbi:MAG: ABC transporter ATP-binding protein [Acidimicrobiia bacterium]|nr:ABC transporter ATP-binding protein [Acidimicrobiia bacterium]
MTTRLSVHSLGVEIDRSVLLTGVDLTVDPGEWLGLIGPNGAGKTTLLRAVVGLVDSFGSVRVDGDDLGGLSAGERARRVALVPQRPIIPPGMDAFTYVLLGRTPHLSYFASEGKHDVEIAIRTLDEMGVAELSHRDMSTLSGGELQRVVLARALAQEPEILLLDEPTSALDVGNQQQVLEVIDGMRSLRGLTVVAAIHDLTLAAQFCDRLALLSEGELVASGPPQQVLTEETIRVHYDATVNIVWIDEQLAVIPTRQNGVEPPKG